MLITFGAVPDVLLLVGDESALHHMLADLAGPGFLRIERVLLMEFESEVLVAFGASPSDGHAF